MLRLGNIRDHSNLFPIYLYHTKAANKVEHIYNSNCSYHLLLLISNYNPWQNDIWTEKPHPMKSKLNLENPILTQMKVFSRTCSSIIQN